VADNGSTDDTHKKVASILSKEIRYLSVGAKGKGIAIRKTAELFQGDFFGFIDADLSANPNSIQEMINILMRNDSDIVIGSRFLDEKIVNRGFFRRFTSRIFNLIQYIFFGLDIKDTQCGLKLMNKKAVNVLLKCKETTWFLDLEFLSLSIKNKLRITEIPVIWTEFFYKNRVAKLNVWRDGIYAIIAVIRIKIRYI
jgi:dolichyl-phosphate beta-glucosyltransferase